MADKVKGERLALLSKPDANPGPCIKLSFPAARPFGQMAWQKALSALMNRPPGPREAPLSAHATTALTRRRLHPQGPSARRTALWAVLSEDGQASACPRAYFQDYFPNARSAVGNPEAHCQGVALDAAFVCAVGARRKREAGRMRAGRAALKTRDLTRFRVRVRFSVLEVNEARQAGFAI